MKNKLPWIMLAGIVRYLLLRRLELHSGSTDEEVHASLPGDEVIPHPMVEMTHAIAIAAPSSEVWNGK